MSSTRTAKNDSALRQERYASSPEFDRGLMATRVAALCDTIESAEDRELIWFIHYLSHQEGGLAAVAADIIAKFPDRIGTATMLQLAKPDTESFSAEEVQKIRIELPYGHCVNFPLKWETTTAMGKLIGTCQADRFQRVAERQAELERARLNRFADDALERGDLYAQERLDREKQEFAEAEKHPSSYPVKLFHDLCLKAAAEGLPGYRHCDGQTDSLDRELAEICLNPECDFAAGGPWYFPKLIETLREYMAAFQKAKRAGEVVTALGREVYDALDYTFSERVLCLIHGEARTGKSFSGRAWCEQHPGRARFIEVPPFSDDVGFFRAIARGLGLGNFLNYKANEIRDRVQSVLLAKHQDLILVFDEAQRLWPTSWRQKPEPKRIVWVMTMANSGVPIALIATPQFIETQKAVEKAGWNSAQLTGRLGHYVPLPTTLSADDLEAVAKSKLPGVEPEALRALAVYARASHRYLAAIDSVAKRARYLAKQAGHETVSSDDVRRAMQESVIPSDTKLHRALDTGKAMPAALTAPEESIVEDEAPALEQARTNRTMRPESSPLSTSQRRGKTTELVTD